MKKRNLSILVIIIIIVVIVLVIAFMPKPNTNPIKIGIIGHFSGEYAEYGIPMKKAAELYIQEVNNKGGINGRNIQLIIENDGTDATKAASAINKLINIDKVDYILSAQGSGATSVIVPIIQNNNKILMITLGSAPGIPKNKDYVFRSVVPDNQQGSEIVRFIKDDLNSKKISGLYVNDAYGVGIKEIINNNLNTQTEMFEANDKDFKTQLLKIKQNNPDTLVIVARNEFPNILRQIEELNINVNIIASETFKGMEIKESEDYAEGIFVPFTQDPIDYVDFTNKYKLEYNQEPSPYSMYAYDGTAALIKAIDYANDNVDDVKTKLKTIHFNGASGEVGFDSNGDRTGTKYLIYQYLDGKFVKFD